MNPVLNVKWMDATLVIEEFAMVYVNLGYVNPFVGLSTFTSFKRNVGTNPIGHVVQIAMVCLVIHM